MLEPPARRASCIVVGLLCAALGLGGWLLAREQRPARLFRSLPPTATYADAASSPTLRLGATMTLGEDAAPGRRIAHVELTVQSATGAPLRRLQVTALLDEALLAYMDDGYTYPARQGVGTVAPVDLEPGVGSDTLVCGDKFPVPDPAALPAAERERLEAALREPLRVGLWWEGGEEYLLVVPQEME